ncbi:MAG: hypothetical protein IPP51_16285 [Bacteroidetes bacterium]|nr:hypothetical protein [Bacteroidota bacterium]
MKTLLCLATLLFIGFSSPAGGGNGTGFTFSENKTMQPSDFLNNVGKRIAETENVNSIYLEDSSYRWRLDTSLGVWNLKDRSVLSV